MIVEFAVASLMSLQGIPALPNPQLEQQRVQQTMMVEMTKKIAEEKAEREKIVAQRAELEAQINELDTAVADLKSYFVEPGRDSPNKGGNSYAWGQCTWYARSQRPDIGSFWGNANRWTSSARAEGFEIGKEPKIGAIGVSYAGWAGHVFIVESMSRDKSEMTISEMNYAGGIGRINIRTISSVGYDFIYSLK